MSTKIVFPEVRGKEYEKTECTKTLVVGASYYTKDKKYKDSNLSEFPKIVREKWLKWEDVGKCEKCKESEECKKCRECEKCKNRRRKISEDKGWKLYYYTYVQKFLKCYCIAPSLEHVVYYNFEQRMLNSPSEKTNARFRQEDSEALFELMRELKPDRIVVFSVKTYNAIKNESMDEFGTPKIKYVRKSNQNRKYNEPGSKTGYVSYCYYEMGPKTIPIICIPHLSRLGNSLLCNDAISEMLKEPGIKFCHSK